jgi:hypothetical protein
MSLHGEKRIGLWSSHKRPFLIRHVWRRSPLLRDALPQRRLGVYRCRRTSRLPFDRPRIIITEAELVGRGHADVRVSVRNLW